ncbi:hypothetical protein FSP39_006382 [Pinctada imbricata]|uniref:G8 domain-containing protein n=1 Tax=Pinctada imbricata TaxID=66713 RepID=A0AA88XTN6_PINIB|nr:hypothetical protein FSP39_006382 [Pinctada imbricata]
MITLTGLRGEYNIEGFGQKFIGVEQGGVLELHGDERLSWTKLNRTVPKVSKKYGILFHHKACSSINKAKDSWFQGLAVYVVDTDSMEKQYGAFYLSGHDKEWTERGTPIKPGKVVMISVQNSLNRGADLYAVYDAVEEFAFGAVTGKSKIRRVGAKDAYAMILISGDPASPVELVDTRDNRKDHTRVSLNYTMFDRMLKFTAISVVYDVNWKTYVDFYIKDTEYTYPVLDVASDASSWKPGDKIVVTSTDYSWTQAEIGVVIHCPLCSKYQIRIDLEPSYTHWGEIIENVDMRGEVALLSRDIVVQGEMEDSCPVKNGNCDEYSYDTFGGHIQKMAFILTKMPPGAFSFHKHSLSGFIISGMLAINNVRTPSTFWIVNPLTNVRNNVAAGSEHTGFWFLFPDEPLGPSRTLQMMHYDEARHTPILEINNNVAHSNIVVRQFLRINIDQKLMDDYSVGSVNYYQPRFNASDPDSMEKEVLIYRMTVYFYRMADSARGVTFASHHPLIGFVVYDGPLYLQHVWFNHFVTNNNYTSSAIGFKLHNEFSSSAISAVSGLRFGFDDGGKSLGLRIFDGNGSIPGYSDYDGDVEATIRDLDGSLTSYPDTQLVRVRPFYLTKECVIRWHWNLALCPHHYTKLNVVEEDSFAAYVNYKRSSMPFMVRDDIPGVNETRTGTASSDFMLILGQSYSYSLHWTSNIPQTFHLSARGIEKKLSSTVRVGICLPRNCTFDLHSWTPKWLPTIKDWVRVTTLDEAGWGFGRG